MSNNSYPRYFTHLKSKTPTYFSWRAMKARCCNPKDPSYPRYGGRGIAVCARWFVSFENFLSDLGERPTGMTLDRFPDVNGNYEPSNCRWATPKMQARNARSNVMLEIDGQVKSLPEWCEIYGVSAHMVRMRLRNGWGQKTALLTAPISREERGRITGLKNRLHADTNSKSA